MNVMVVHNGKDKNHTVDNVGTVPAALASYLAIQAFKPDLVISAGTAGGFKEKVIAVQIELPSPNCRLHFGC